MDNKQKRMVKKISRVLVAFTAVLMFGCATNQKVKFPVFDDQKRYNPSLQDVKVSIQPFIDITKKT